MGNSIHVLSSNTCMRRTGNLFNYMGNSIHVLSSNTCMRRTWNLFNYTAVMDLMVSIVMLLVTLCKQVELVCRIAIVLLQTHYNQLVTTPSARPVLSVLRDILYARVKVILQFSHMYRIQKVYELLYCFLDN